MVRFILDFAKRSPMPVRTAIASMALFAACGSKNGTTVGGTGSGGTGGVGAGGNPTGGASGGGASGGTGNNAGATGTGGQSGGVGGSISSGLGGSISSGAGTAGSGASSGGGASGGIGGTGGATTGLGGTTGGATGAAGLGGASGQGGTAGTAVACQAPLAVTGTAATVTVNLGAAAISTVGPDLMGIHTSVYDSMMQAPTTPPLLKAIGVTSLRYPGGSYADSYHWELNTGTSTPAAGAGSNVIYIAPGADFGHFISLLENVGADAMITVNYGVDSSGTGPGVPQAAAAWVAYANGLPTDTTAIGVDSTGKDWNTVGYWAGLRAAAPLAVDDGQNFLRISHPAPVGIKYWEVGNELYGNGYYYGGCGWEPDMHAAYPATGTTCTGRQNNAALSPTTYGMAVKAFAQAMKAVDPTVKVGGIVHWPYTEYANWNGSVLPQACVAMDFAVNHWYAGTTLNSLLTVAGTDIPGMYKDLRTAFTTAANGCGTKGATLPIAVTEWGPNTNNAGDLQTALSATPPTHTQLPGIFAAESYANFMEQGALAVHWLELHNNSYLGSTDTPAWGYHGAQMAHALAGVGDALIPATVSAGDAGAPTLLAHASKHADGSMSVLLTNTSVSTTAAVTVNVTGGATPLACVGTRYAYTPVATDSDGTVTSAPIFSATDGGSVIVSVPPYSVVVVAFPQR